MRHEVMTNSETRQVAVIIRTTDFKVIDLEMSFEETRKLYADLGEALAKLEN
jgi:hypothetical protein